MEKKKKKLKSISLYFLSEIFLSKFHFTVPKHISCILFSFLFSLFVFNFSNLEYKMCLFFRVESFFRKTFYANWNFLEKKQKKEIKIRNKLKTERMIQKPKNQNKKLWCKLFFKDESFKTIKTTNWKYWREDEKSWKNII